MLQLRLNRIQTIAIQCKVQRWALKAAALKELSIQTWASLRVHLRALWLMWQELHNPHPNSKLVALSLVTLQQVMPAGNLLHCRFVFCNCQLRICATLRLFCRTSTILFSLWCTISLLSATDFSTCLWEQPAIYYSSSASCCTSLWWAISSFWVINY